MYLYCITNMVPVYTPVTVYEGFTVKFTETTIPQLPTIGYVANIRDITIMTFIQYRYCIS